MSGKLLISFMYNVNMQFAEMAVEKTHLLVRQGLEPLLDVLERHPAIKSAFFFTGYSDLYLQEQAPYIIERVRRGSQEGRYELGTYTYAHPVLSLLPYEDAYRQIRKGLECDEHVWGIRPTGLLLPEIAWDISLPHIMKRLNLEWVAIYKEIVPRYAQEETYPGSVWVRGILDSRAMALLANYSLSSLLGDVLTGSTTVESLLETLMRLASQSGGDQLVVFKRDAEFLWYLSRDRLREDELPLETAQRFDKILTAVSNLSFVEHIGLHHYLDEHPPEEEVYAESMSGHATLETWQRGKGREKLNTLEAEARGHIRAAQYAIELAAQGGADVSSSREVLEAAWDWLLLAENSDGRAFVPHPSRQLFVASCAIKATQLAKQAIDEIESRDRDTTK